MKKEWEELIFTNGWVDEDLYPINENTIKWQDEYLLEDHKQGRHEKYHVIQCASCQQEYNT